MIIPLNTISSIKQSVSRGLSSHSTHLISLYKSFVQSRIEYHDRRHEISTICLVDSTNTAFKTKITSHGTRKFVFPEKCSNCKQRSTCFKANNLPD